MKNKIIMLGPSLNATRGGGIKSVVTVYKRFGLFRRWPVHYIGTVQPGNVLTKLRTAILALLRFISLLLTRQVSVVHVHTASRASFWRKSVFVLLAFLARRPVILHLHGAEFHIFYEKESGPMAKRFIRFIFNNAKRIIVLSTQWKRIVSNISNNKHIVCIFNPVEIEDPIAISAFSRKKNILLFLGELGKRKGTFDLLDALVRLKTKFPDVKLLCGGDGDLERVAARARTLGISDSVEIMGWVAGDAKRRLLAEATVYVLPSYNEGLPMSLLEALAAGLPVISTPVGGIPDALEDGIEGYLIEPGNIDALSHAIEKLLCDEQCRTQMGVAGRKKVEQYFTPEQVLPQLETLYRELEISPTEPWGKSQPQ